MIHALSRADNNGARSSPEEQMVPAYSGFQACHHSSLNRSKPYYHTTYNKPPSKSVLYDIMVKVVLAMREQSIPFGFVVGDMPTYKTIVKLKAENSGLFKKIIPILGVPSADVLHICYI